MLIKHVGPLGLLFTATLASSSLAQERSASIELELGATWQERNRVQIPNTMAADRFKLTDIAGNGPWTSGRISVDWPLTGRHGLRVVLAPLSYEEQGSLPADTRFAGAGFSASQPVTGEYQFNSWRVGYHYQFYEANDWRLRLGATANIRFARIELSQGTTRAFDDDLGFVPLLHFSGDYRFDSRWSLQFDFEGLAGGPGRAFDVGLRLVQLRPGNCPVPLLMDAVLTSGSDGLHLETRPGQQ